jgi:predicted PurR-regulated permease PerM
VSLFLALAVEPGVNRLAARGWRRGTATAAILVGVFFGFLIFVAAIGTLVGQQIATLLGDSEKYVNRTVNFINDNFDTQISASQVIDSINDPNGPVQRFIRSQQGRVVDLSVAALGVVEGFVGDVVHLLPGSRWTQVAPFVYQAAPDRRDGC